MSVLRKSLVMVQTFKVLPDKVCDGLVELFENDTVHHERVDNESKPTFTQLNLNKHHAKIVPTLIDYVLDTLAEYKKHVQAAKYIPTPQFFEEFRVKRYEVGGVDRFDEHVDVVDHASAKRCLAMLFYLNTVTEGGCTLFPYQERVVTPIQGYVSIFPPTWEYPHSGEPPVSNTKYIMSTYLHYG
jgi:prolyl 4-hydroxylase